MSNSHKKPLHLHNHEHHDGCCNHDQVPPGSDGPWDAEETEAIQAFSRLGLPHGEPLPLMTEAERKLWRRSRGGDGEARNELAEKYFGIVEANATNVVETIVSAIEESDLHQAAVVGYLEALAEYDVDKDIRFEEFSSLMIRRAMITELLNYIRE